MITEREIAQVHGRETARDCDCCLHKRARWYCAADDAFLCQACDTSVHSANPLASRHERVKLETSPLMAANDCKADENCVPFWHQGFTRKARTPRHGRPTMAAKAAKQQETMANHLHPLVPEIGSEETTPEENEEQLQYCVPVFDPFAAELCSSDEGGENDIGNELNALLNDDDHDDMELAEFAADVESLLGTGLDDGQPCGDMIKGFGDVNGQEQNVLDFSFEEAKVKVEDEELQAAMETLNWDFYCTSSMNYDDEEEDKQKAKGSVEKTKMDDGGKVEVHKRMLLRLNYEAVMAAWGSQGSPWTNGNRPEFNPDGCLPDILGTSTGENYHQYEGREHSRASNGGREARVSRYREKRRRRLFSKKIRYEVRKLNAEKRPRMKGRFVKRTSIAGPYFL